MIRADENITKMNHALSICGKPEDRCHAPPILRKTVSNTNLTDRNSSSQKLHRSIRIEAKGVEELE